MFGLKIKEFDNSDGTINSFNKIFFKTPFDSKIAEYAEIKDIVDDRENFISDPFIRWVHFYDKDWKLLNKIKHNFGYNNFLKNEDYSNISVRFKYIARDLDGNIIGKGYNFPELAKNIGCHVSTIKLRLKNKMNKDDKSKSKYKFNISKIEL